MLGGLSGKRKLMIDALLVLGSILLTMFASVVVQDLAETYGYEVKRLLKIKRKF